MTTVGTSRLSTFSTMVAHTIAKRSLLEEGERVLVAFSGGADSTATAVVLHALGYEVILGHIDHQMRADSAADAEASRRIAEQLGLPIAVESVVVDPPTEEEARKRRYEALSLIAGDVRAGSIATGHTLDDQAETVLMRLGRGGTAIGIPYKRDNVVRPLLDLRRVDTVSLCKHHGINFVIDPTNEDIRYTRNLIRNTVFPQFHDDLIVRLAGIGRHVTEDAMVLSNLIDDYSQFVNQLTDGVIVDRQVLMDTEPSIAKGIIRRALESVGLEPTRKFVDEVAGKAIRKTGAELAIGPQWILRIESKSLVLERRRATRVLAPASLVIPGVTHLSEFALTATSEIVSTPGVATKFEAFFDLDKVQNLTDSGTNELTVRSRRPGDRFEPVGMIGTKKLQDFMVDEKIPRDKRNSVPVLSAGDHILWIIGYRLDRRFIAEAHSTNIVRLRFAPQD